MAHTDYTATVKKTMLVNYQCENCEASSRYSVHLTASGKYRGQYIQDSGQQSMGKDAAARKAMQNLREQIQKREKEGNYGHKKCPKCGYLQSWMIKSAQKRRDTIMGGILAVLIFTLLSYFLPAFRGMFSDVLSSNADMAERILSLFIAGIVFSLFWIPFIFLYAFVPFNPNKKFKAAERVKMPSISYDPPYF